MLAEGSGSLLVVVGLSKSYEGRAVVADLDVRVEAGDAVALTGPNGCGKSTVLRCLSGHERLSGTRFEVGGRPVAVASAAYRRQVFPVFDDFAFFPDLSVREHLEFLAGLFGVRDREGVARSAMEEFGVQAVGEQFPATLSAGQARRVAFAAAAVRPWSVLLLDEPEQRLDEEGRDCLVRFLGGQLAAGRGVVFATHDLALVRRVGARVVPAARWTA